MPKITRHRTRLAAANTPKGPNERSLARLRLRSSNWRKDQLLRLALCGGLKKGESVRVGGYLIATLDSETASTDVSQQQLAEKMGMHQTSVSRALKALQKCSLIKIDSEGRKNRYRLTPVDLS
jgi:DNA-binding transcriptional ArsR family regulator